MQKVQFGFIGTGTMGGALAGAACKGVGPAQVLLANRTRAKAEALAATLGCAVAADNAEAAARAEYLCLGVKPQGMAGMLAGIAPVLAARAAAGERFLLVSMAAGLSCASIAKMAGGDYPVLRIMPNTPAAVGAGMILTARSALVTDPELARFTGAMAAAGRFDTLDEGLLDAGSAVAGCGPAFACLFLEALADGGVACGLPRAKAAEYAAQMLLGTAALALQTGQHPAALKDAVCSPGGSTIRGVQALEANAFRGAVLAAVDAAYAKTRALGEA